MKNTRKFLKTKFLYANINLLTVDIYAYTTGTQMQLHKCTYMYTYVQHTCEQGTCTRLEQDFDAKCNFSNAIQNYADQDNSLKYSISLSL